MVPTGSGKEQSAPQRSSTASPQPPDGVHPTWRRRCSASSWETKRRNSTTNLRIGQSRTQLPWIENGRNCFFRKKRTHVSCHYTQRPGPSSQTGVEVVCNAFTTKVQNWTFFMSELIHCLSTFMSVSPRPIFCIVRGGPCRTPAQPPAATSAALPYLRKTAKIRRSSGGPRLSWPGEGWADARERGPPVSSQNPSPASGRDKRGPPVSSQNRKDSSVFGRAALVAAERGVGG